MAGKWDSRLGSLADTALVISFFYLERSNRPHNPEKEWLMGDREKSELSTKWPRLFSYWKINDPIRREILYEVLFPYVDNIPEPLHFIAWKIYLSHFISLRGKYTWATSFHCVDNIPEPLHCVDNTAIEPPIGGPTPWSKLQLEDLKPLKQSSGRGSQGNRSMAFNYLLLGEDRE
jgi:hypothetical protein